MRPRPCSFWNVYGRGRSGPRAGIPERLPAGERLSSVRQRDRIFPWGAAAQVHLGNIGAPLEYEHFNVANTNQAQVFSLDAVISLL
jgi:hypothetical protein